METCACETKTTILSWCQASAGSTVIVVDQMGFRDIYAMLARWRRKTVLCVIWLCLLMLLGRRTVSIAKNTHTHTHTNACMMKDVDRILLLIISGSFVFSGHSKWNLR